MALKNTIAPIQTSNWKVKKNISKFLKTICKIFSKFQIYQSLKKIWEFIILFLP